MLTKFMDGQKNVADTWTTSRRSTSPTPHPGTRGTCARAPSRWCAMINRCEHEEISNPLRKFSQVLDKNKDDRIPLFRRLREYGKDHSVKHYEQNWSGRAKIGKPTGRKLPLDHPHNNGGNTCRGINPCTSYSRTNDYVKLWLRHCVQLYAQRHHA